MTTLYITPEEAAEECKITSRRLLGQAEAEFAKGDLLQASEKGWGAVAQAVKAAAILRGLEHRSHRALRLAADNFAEETGRKEISRLFTLADGLHANYYEAWMRPSVVRDHLDAARELVGILESLPAPNGDLRVRPIRARPFIRDRSDWEGEDA